MESKLKNVSKGALCFKVENCHAEESEDGKARFIMKANSGGVIQNHWYWGNLAIDMDGVQINKQKLPALRAHDTDRIAGWTDKVTADSEKGIMAEGPLTEVTEDGKKVKDLLEDGFPWQASIYIPASSVEEVAAGETAEVNGYTFNGPGHIMRKTTLREVSFCTLGADENTDAVLLGETAENIEIAIFSNSNKGGPEMDLKELTLEDLKAQRPDLVTALAAETGNIAAEDGGVFAAEKETAVTDALTAERERVAGILTAAGEFNYQADAVKAIEEGAELAATVSSFKDKKLAELQTAAPQAPGANPDPENATDPVELFGEEKYKAEWDKSNKERKEFKGNFKEYAAFRKAEDKGLIKIKSDVK